MATTAVYGSNRCAAVFSPTSRAASTWHASQWSGACQLRWPASRNTLHAHRHRYTPGRCAATCLTSQPQQARLAQQPSIHRLWHNTCRTPPHPRCHRHKPPHTLPYCHTPPHMTASISHHAQFRHTLAAIATRRYTLTAVALRRRTLAAIAIHRHMATSCAMLHSQPSLHAATLAAIATCRRHAPRRSAAQHGPYVACSLYGLS